MQYDPIKKKLGAFFNKAPFLRKLFYRLLDLLLLRTWHIKKEIRIWAQLRKKTLAADRDTFILDAGAGFGQYTYFLSKINNEWNILSVDVKEEQVADCSGFFSGIGVKNVHFQKADLTKFIMETNFDLVLCVDVMEHILEDELVFKNYFKSLKDGGMLLISTPSDQGGSDVHEGRISFIEEHVRDGYNVGEIEAKLRKAGFTDVETRYSYGPPGKLSWRLSMKYPILLLGANKLFFIILPLYYIILYPLCYALNHLDLLFKWKSGTGLIVKAWVTVRDR